MASTAIGKLDEFDPTTAYVKRVALYFQANGIADNKQVYSCISEHHRSKKLFITDKLDNPHSSERQIFRTVSQGPKETL